MWKNIYAKTLLAFFVYLTPVSVAGCNQAPYNSTEQADNQNTINTEINELDQSIDALIREIQVLKDEDKQSFKSDNIQNANKKIDNISIAIQKIRETSSAKQPENSEKLLQDIEQRIKNIQTITNLLSNGLSEEVVGQIQKKLGIVKNTANNKNSGKLDAETKSKISNSGKLDEETKSKISNSLTQNTSHLIQDTDRLIVRSLKQQVKELQAESKNNNKVNLIAWTSLTLSFISLLLFATLLSERGGFSALSDMFKNRKDEEKSDETSTNSSEICKDESQINKRKNDEYQEFSSKLSRLENKIDNIEKHYNNILQHQQTEHTDINQNFEKEPDDPSHEVIYKNQQNFLNQTSQYNPKETVNLQTRVPDFLASYNNQPDSLYSKATEVNVTEESIDERRLGNGQTAIFETKKGGSYWILEEKNIYYLVPKKYLPFNEYQYKTAQALFQCQGYQRSSKQKFHVIKPARVTSISGDQWQLEEMGILEFC